MFFTHAAKVSHRSPLTSVITSPGATAGLQLAAGLGTPGGIVLSFWIHVPPEGVLEISKPIPCSDFMIVTRNTVGPDDVEMGRVTEEAAAVEDGLGLGDVGAGGGRGDMGAADETGRGVVVPTAVTGAVGLMGDDPGFIGLAG